MSLSNSLLAYQDCLALLEGAMADPLGARLRVRDMDEAVYQRNRVHYARKLHRDENAKTYEPGHAMHGKSEYDAITVRIRTQAGATYLYLERTDKVRGEIEPLSSAPELEPFTHRQVEIEVKPSLAPVVETIKRRI